MLCKNCGSEISDEAVFCVHCKTQIKKVNKASIKSKKRNVWIIVIIISVILLSCLSLKPTQTDNTNGSDPLVSTNNNSSQKDDGFLKEGTYKVGVDIPAGEYYIICTGSSCYCQVSSDSSGKFSSIISNENFYSFMFVTVKDGQYLQVKDGKFVPAEKANVPKADENGNYGEGMYRVGIDIPAGEYKVTCKIGDSCYVEVNSDSTGSFRSIVSNENVETFYYISVETGQYLTVDGGEFTKVN